MANRDLQIEDQKRSAWKTAVALLIFINFTSNKMVHYVFQAVFLHPFLTKLAWHILELFFSSLGGWQIEDLGIGSSN